MTPEKVRIATVAQKTRPIRVRDAVLDWLRRHPEKVDGDL